jgi:hypothetical protein
VNEQFVGVDWEMYDVTYAEMGPRFSFRGPWECFMCGKKIVNIRDRRIVQALSDHDPIGNAHGDCLNNLHTDVIAKRFLEALLAAVSGHAEQPHPFTPVTHGRML